MADGLSQEEIERLLAGDLSAPDEPVAETVAEVVEDRAVGIQQQR